MQKELLPDNGYFELKKFLKAKGVHRPLLVCGNSFNKLPVADVFDFPYERFSGFTPNPLYEQCIEGAHVYEAGGCDGIIAVGGGSAIDVAKCIRYYLSKLGKDVSNVPLVAIPTTAGTGSESTRFAVIYRGGEKQSVEDDLCYPDAFVLDGKLLSGLPDLQRKATLLDALCHGIESLWSVRATEESRGYAKKALDIIEKNWSGYLTGEDGANHEMLKASNYAGKAINISKTTAGHAMCYKLTSMYGIPHGQAVALCMKVLIPFTLDIAAVNGSDVITNLFEKIFEKAKPVGVSFDLKDLEIMTRSVNADRLSNHPVKLSEATIKNLYERIITNNEN